MVYTIQYIDILDDFFINILKSIRTAYHNMTLVFEKEERAQGKMTSSVYCFQQTYPGYGLRYYLNICQNCVKYLSYGARRFIESTFFPEHGDRLQNLTAKISLPFPITKKKIVTKIIKGCRYPLSH